jgi:hypothetical protein
MKGDCRCPHPVGFEVAHKADTCVKCGRFINPLWTSNDKTLAAFFDRLARSIFPTNDLTGRPAVSEDWLTFRRHVEARELEGRPKFGHRFLSRDNIWDAREEAADLALYALLDVLRARRDGTDEVLNHALNVAQKAFEGYSALSTIRRVRSGSP